MIIEYIKKVISKWWILLGFIPEVFDKFSVYFDSELKIPEGSTLYLLLALWFISTYLVWKEEKEKVLNNCVAPEIGLAIFESALNIYNHSQNNQIGLFTQLG